MYINMLIYLLKHLHPLTDIDRDIAYNVMKSCKCQILVRDTVVVRQGERGNAFYIILRGQVSVFVKEGKYAGMCWECCQYIRKSWWKVNASNSIFVVIKVITQLNNY